MKAIALQMALATLRHAMTGQAFATVVVSDEWLTQTASIIVGVGAYWWSLKRKTKTAPALAKAEGK